ncbi:hypothetical protein [Acerihabitans sp.]|uniref:hypothetical protein n=1 Tax=Acerihabitans sp. TaxID=2811394 RepID=UPI002ED838ED
MALTITALSAGEWIGKGIGTAMPLGVVAISLGLDTGILTRVSTACRTRRVSIPSAPSFSMPA